MYAAADHEETRPGNPTPTRGHHALLLIAVGAALVVAGLVFGGAAAVRGPTPVALAEPFADSSDGPTIDHAALDRILKKHVSAEGWVDYEGLRSDPADLDAYIGLLAGIEFDPLSRDEKLAVLINAYNAFTLRLVLDHWPVKSIRDIPEAKRWKDRRWRIGALTVSLDEIENQYLRPRFREPRIHFAINCASVGCPPLRREAYVAKRIDRQLQQQAERVHGDERWFRFDRPAGVVYLSKLYDWFAGDFKQVDGSVLEYASRFSPPLRSALDEGTNLKTRWLDWDWSLNHRPAGE